MNFQIIQEQEGGGQTVMETMIFHFSVHPSLYYVYRVGRVKKKEEEEVATACLFVH